ncbi:MAG TPA: TonB-dependent receptor [Bryobacteraceae bacterium]|nr:TonB-dependent receptor [Bryobacteraceae bacterium]
MMPFEPFRCFLPLALLLPCARAATLEGAVTDPQSKPVPGAAILLTSTTNALRWSATTSASGSWRIDNLPAGDYLLRAGASGFATFLTDPFHLDLAASKTENIVLQIAGSREEIVVTASSTPQTSLELSKSLSVVDAAEIQQRDALDLASALDLTAGLRVQQLGGPGAYSNLQLRGLRPEDTAVLVDGFRLRDASATQADASGLIEDLLTTDAGQIEVLRGSGSSLYGTNAIGGVVNVITDEGGGRTRGNVLLEGGSLGLFRGHAQIAGGWRGDTIPFSLGVSQLYVADGVGGDLPYRDTNAQGSIGFHLSPTTHLFMRFYGANAFGKLASEPDVLGNPSGFGIVPAIPNVTFLPAPDNPDYTRAARFASGVIRLTGQPAPALGYSLSYQAVSDSRRYGDGPAGTGYQPLGSTRSLYDGRIQTVNAHADYRLDRHQLITAGYEFENENYANDNTDFTNPAAGSATNVTQRSHAAYAQDQIRLLDGRLEISGGFRAQFFALNAPEFLPAAAAPYQGIAFTAPAPAYTGDGSIAYFFRRSGTKLRAHIGRGYRAPSLFERFGVGFDPVFGYAVYGDPRLHPEHMLSLDSGIDQSFAQGRAKISAAYFYTWLENVIAFDTTGLIDPTTDPFGRYVGYISTRGGISRGVELAASLTPARALTFSGAYTYVNAIERAPIVGDTLQTFAVPRNQFSIAATGRLSQRFLLTAETRISSSYLDPIYGSTITQVFRFPGLHSVDLAASYRIPISEFRSLRFFARVDNLLNQTYFEDGFPTPGRTGRAGLQFEF